MINNNPIQTEILDEVDIRIISKDTVVKGPAWYNTYPKCMEERNMPWDYDPDGRGWLKRGIQPPLDLVPVNEEIGLYEPINAKYRVANSVVKVPWNKTGIYFSRNRNVEEHLRKAVFDLYGYVNPDAADWIRFLEAEGYKKPMEIRGIATERMKDAYAKLYFGDKGSILALNKDISKLAEELASKYNISEEEAEYAIMNTVYHELGHNQGVRGVYAERNIGKLLNKFWEKKAKLSSGEKAELFRKLAKINEDYANRFSGYTGLIGEYIQEALEKGYEGKKIEEYVTNRLKEETSTGKSKLEEKVEEEYKNSKSTEKESEGDEERMPKDGGEAEEKEAVDEEADDGSDDGEE